jgi:hypothetical protein
MPGEAVERSIAGQVEFWAKLGCSVELLPGAPEVLSLCRHAAARPLSDCPKSVDSPKAGSASGHICRRAHIHTKKRIWIAQEY